MIMATNNIKRDKAIKTIKKLLHSGHYIPMLATQDDWSGFVWVSPDLDLYANNLEDFAFRTVPMNEIAEKFKANGINSKEYDVCVEFKEKAGKNPYTEQYLLWNVD